MSMTSILHHFVNVTKCMEQLFADFIPDPIDKIFSNHEQYEPFSPYHTISTKPCMYMATPHLSPLTTEGTKETHLQFPRKDVYLNAIHKQSLYLYIMYVCLNMEGFELCVINDVCLM